MKIKVIIPSRLPGPGRPVVLLIEVLLAAFLFQPSARAQLNYTGAGTGEIEFSGQPVAAYGGIPPLWATDGFTGGNDILASPGATFNSINYVNPNIYGTGVVPLLNGIFAVAAPGNDNGVAFGGGSMALNPTAVGFSIQMTAPGNVSVGIGAESANFTVGAGGVGANIGTYLSLDGYLAPGDAIAASLVTYINDTTTAQSVALAEVLGAAFDGTNTKYVALFGTLGSPASGANAWVLFGGGGSSYTGFASASVANFLKVGDNVTITSVLTEAADPYGGPATINADGLPANLNGATLPDTVVYGTQPIPEPGALSLLALGLAAGLVFRRRRVTA